MVNYYDSQHANGFSEPDFRFFQGFQSPISNLATEFSALDFSILSKSWNIAKVVKFFFKIAKICVISQNAKGIITAGSNNMVPAVQQSGLEKIEIGLRKIRLIWCSRVQLISFLSKSMRESWIVVMNWWSQKFDDNCKNQEPKTGR